MIHSATHVVLLAFVALWSLIIASGLLLLLLLLILPLSIVPLILRGLHVKLGTIVGIMPHFTALETAIELNWSVGSNGCTCCVA